MALNTPQITPTKDNSEGNRRELPRGDYQRCPQCDMLFSLPEINSHQSAYCPRCQAKIRDGRDWSLTRGGNGFHHAVADAVCTGRTAVAYLAVRYSYRRQRHARHLANDQTGRYDNGGDGLFLRYWCPSFWCPP